MINPDLETVVREVVKTFLEKDAAHSACSCQASSENAKPIAQMIDHTLLKPEATEDDVRRLCGEARKFGFASVCIHPCHVRLAASLLKDSEVSVCTVVGFPLGANTASVKAFEARQALADGADEIDMVLNIGALKSGKSDFILEEIRAVRAACPGKVLKVILETGLLTWEEKILACRLAQEAGADFIKTSTGFSPQGASVEDVELLRKTVGSRMGVKASGGIRDAAFAEKLVRAGANRLGTSASIAIAQAEPQEPAARLKPY